MFGRFFRPALLRSAAAAGGFALLPPSLSPSHCAPTTKDSAQQQQQQEASASTSLGLPLNLGDMSGLQVQMRGVSGLTGYTAGYAIKRTFKVFLFTSGCIFMGLQSLAQNGLITVHWEQIEQKMNSLADLNDDGVVDHRDLQLTTDKVQAYLSAGLPSAGAFGTCFLWGLRS
jgi:uncharacterized membrane protein (Fun14 family)